MGRKHSALRDPQSQCQGKTTFLTFTRARQAADRTSRVKGREGDGYEAYHCPVCQRFHVGTRQHRKAKRMRLRVVG